jgi:hypothetical protein
MAPPEREGQGNARCAEDADKTESEERDRVDGASDEGLPSGDGDGCARRVA